MATTDERRAVWLLDVDGVLNAGEPGWGPGTARSGWARALGGTFRITWAEPLVARLVALDASGRAEIRWATTWVPWIGQIESLLGLPHWPSAFDRAGIPPSQPAPAQKLAAALDVVEREGRRLVWTDDDAIPRAGPGLDRLTVRPARTLLVRPAPLRGLQPDHVEVIEAFLAG